MAQSDDNHRGRGEEPVVYFVGGRTRSDTLTVEDYETFVLVSGVAVQGLFVFFAFQARFGMILAYNDLGVAGGVASALAGISFALLTLIYQISERDLYLKLAATLITFTLLASTLLVVFALFYYPKDFSFRPEVSIVFVFTTALLFIPCLLVRTVGRNWGRWRKLFHFLPFLLPAPVFVAVSEGRLVTSAILLLAFSVVALIVLIAMFVYRARKKGAEISPEEEFLRQSTKRLRQKVEEQKRYEELKRTLLDVLEKARDRDFSGSGEGNQDYEKMALSQEKVDEELRLRKMFISYRSLNEALNELIASHKLIFDSGAGGYYLAPTQSEIEALEAYVRERLIVVYRGWSEGGLSEKKLSITSALAKKYRYPVEIVEKYLLIYLTRILRDEFVTVGGGANFTIYVRKDAEGIRACHKLWDAWMNENKARLDGAGIKFDAKKGKWVDAENKSYPPPFDETDDPHFASFYETNDPDLDTMNVVRDMVEMKPTGFDLSAAHSEVATLLKGRSLPDDLLVSELGSRDATYQFFCELRRVIKVLPKSEN